jgi:hypothetical protein
MLVIAGLVGSNVNRGAVWPLVVCVLWVPFLFSAGSPHGAKTVNAAHTLDHYHAHRHQWSPCAPHRAGSADDPARAGSISGPIHLEPDPLMLYPQTHLCASPAACGVPLISIDPIPEHLGPQFM